jgi:hypothetical protein
MAKRTQKKRAGAAESPAPARAGRAVRAPAAAPAPRQPLPPGSSAAAGAYLGIAFGLALIVLGLLGAARAQTLPIPLIVALLIAGPLQAALCWKVLRRSRVAWSFAVALSGTAALVCLFSAPKIRDELGLTIALAILPSLVALVVTCLLAAAAQEMTSSSRSS